MNLETTTPESGAPPTQDWILRTSIMDRFPWTDIFQNDRPIELELGAGDGSFLIQYATRNPDRNFLGVERLLGRLRKISRKSTRASLTNVRCMRLEAAYLLQWMIPPGTLSAVHVYFPDPWPKRRHLKRRLVNEEFTAHAAKALQTGGWMHVRTDDGNYFEQMTAVFDANPTFRRAETPAELLSVKTDFESDFNAQGIPTRAASWIKHSPVTQLTPSPAG